MIKTYGQISAETLANISLSIGAIKLSPDKPFLWASGYYMPIYNDNRMLLGSAGHRRLIADSFMNIITQEGIDFKIIVGTSTAGIPHATTLADRMDSPLIYVRDKPKDHGMRNQIEGIDAEKNLERKRVILIEDLISTGGSSAAAVHAIRQANGTIDDCLSIFNYGLDAAVRMFDGREPFDKERKLKLETPCNVYSILDYNTLLEVAKKSGYVNESQIKMLQEWRESPLKWGERHGFPKVEKKK